VAGDGPVTTGFDRLHPGVAHHVVNTLGWRALRPLQKRAISPVLDGSHAMIIAPTAGGKTEAAFLPLLSRMLTEDWRGLSVLYVCPLRALLNNLHTRLESYASLVGRRVALWHGDVTAGSRARIANDPPDVLLTTPESIEAMLISRSVDHHRLFGDVRVVVADEVHAFAGDDLGWHLLAVVERVSLLAGRDLQRIGLSATVANPTELLGWLAGSSPGRQTVVSALDERREGCPDGPGPPDGGAGRADGGASVIGTPAPERSPATPTPEVGIDYVGSVANAGLVISRLHRGQKRLVFCDSRAQAEALATDLRGREITTFVSHSSLSRDERRRSEEAFASASDCVIVATSTLELGIDVGDLDRVIQLEAPQTVASMLQRMGRAGRREGSTRSLLFLATRDETLLQAIGLARLWSSGYVEPVVAPVLPLHLVAQQLIAACLQEGRLGRREWTVTAARLPAFGALAATYGDEIVGHLLEAGLLWDDSGLLSLGPDAERTLGYRHFVDLTSSFTGEPLLTARHGREDLGSLHPLSLRRRPDRPTVVLLGGRSWAVTYIDWRRKVVFVEPAGGGGRSRWASTGRPLSAELCRSMRSVAAGDECGATLSRRAVERLAKVRAELPWAAEGTTAVVRSGRAPRWWTWAGELANRQLVAALGDLVEPAATVSNLTIDIQPDVGVQRLADALRALRENDEIPGPATDGGMIKGLKFNACLPEHLAQDIVRARATDRLSLERTLSEPVSGYSI